MLPLRTDRARQGRDRVSRGRGGRGAPLNDLAYLTGHTLTGAAAVRRELEFVRTRGFAREREEAILGEGGLAAAIFARTGEPVGAIGIAGPRAHPRGRTRACAGDTCDRSGAVSRATSARRAGSAGRPVTWRPAAAYPPHENSNPPHRRAADAGRLARRGLAPRVGVELPAAESDGLAVQGGLGRLRPGSRRALVRRREPGQTARAALSANARSRCAACSRPTGRPAAPI